jgi:hypothetical protein
LDPPRKKSSGAIHKRVPTPMVIVAVSEAMSCALVPPVKDVSRSRGRCEVNRRLVPKSHT